MCSMDITVSLKDSLADVIESEKISDNAGLLNEYSADNSFTPKRNPFLVVFPETKEEVQKIVKYCNESRTPIIPVSSGPPHFRGDTVPEQGGIIMDFSHMKRIIKIDEISRYVWIEPGVTFGKLISELKNQGLKLDAPFLPRSSKSVVTSRLEREPVIIPKYQYDYIDPLLTLEVVYGTGEDFRTGSASGPGTLETLKADKVNPWGPSHVDFFRFISGAQGTMGLVTWAITKTEVLPVIQKLYFVTSDDLQPIAELINQLLRRRVVDECLALNNVNLAAILGREFPYDYVKLKNNLPPWMLMTCIAGYRRRPEERVSIQEKYLNEICEGLGLKAVTTLPGAEGRENTMLKLLSGPWTEEPYWKLRYKGSCHDIFFLTTLSEVTRLAQVMKGVASKYRYPADDIGAYIQPVVQGRGCHCEFNLFCDESNIEDVSELKQLYLDASETLMKNGAFFSRPYGPWANMVYSNNKEEVIALRKLKSIFDPNNILNPGKLCF